MENIDKVVEFLKIKRKEKKLTQGQLSYKSGVSSSILSKIEAGTRKPSLKTVFSIAKALGISKFEILKILDLIEEDDFNMEISSFLKEKLEDHLETISQATSSTIPVYASASAGCGRIVDAEPIAFVNVPFKEYDCIGVKVHGNSMTPTITNEAIAILRRNSEVHSGEVGVFFVNGESYIKRFVEKDGIILLYSDNTCYEPIIITKKDDFECCGKVIKTINKI
ncbi:MAG: LexA family transcriptional regulator [Cetobacterium sp.]|nr:LexA family transcriptional regulator [Cetobacterium sp.]